MSNYYYNHKKKSNKGAWALGIIAFILVIAAAVLVCMQYLTPAGQNLKPSEWIDAIGAQINNKAPAEDDKAPAEEPTEEPAAEAAALAIVNVDSKGVVFNEDGQAENVIELTYSDGTKKTIKFAVGQLPERLMDYTVFEHTDSESGAVTRLYVCEDNATYKFVAVVEGEEAILERGTFTYDEETGAIALTATTANAEAHEVSLNEDDEGIVIDGVLYELVESDDAGDQSAQSTKRYVHRIEYREDLDYDNKIVVYLLSDSDTRLADDVVAPSSDGFWEIRGAFIYHADNNLSIKGAGTKLAFMQSDATTWLINIYDDENFDHTVKTVTGTAPAFRIVSYKIY